ncbi:MAG: DMT family transporter [Synergistaceae bacterium]|jgi:drug/metabolite transporter (DMT)-like permease|nr:DMT family transporter [Synergistaceae bacterium]
MENLSKKVSRARKLIPFIVLLFGVAGVSTGSIFVRLADAHPFVKSAYRVTIASLVFLPFALAFNRNEFRNLKPRDFALTVLSGAFLAFHFATWISSLDYTTVASSVILVDTIPIWIALINLLLGKGRPSRTMWLCIFMSVAGASIIGFGDLSFSGDALFGDALALIGGVMAAAYIYCGGEARNKLGLAPYAVLCYGSCSVIMWGVVFIMGLDAAGFTADTWIAILGMGILSQVVGHSSYNWALRYFSTGFVSIALLGEPIGSAILAYFLFDEYPAGFKLAGFALVIASIVMSGRAEERKKITNAADE